MWGVEFMIMITAYGLSNDHSFDNDHPFTINDHSFNNPQHRTGKMGSQKFSNIHDNTTKSLFPNNIKNEHVENQLVRKRSQNLTKTRLTSSSTNTVRKCQMGTKRNLQCNGHDHQMVAADQGRWTQSSQNTTNSKSFVFWMIGTIFFAFTDNYPPLTTAKCLPEFHFH